VRELVLIISANRLAFFPQKHFSKTAAILMNHFYQDFYNYGKLGQDI
jgi:hypothetical protein